MSRTSLVPTIAEYEFSPAVEPGGDQLPPYVAPARSHDPDDPELYRHVFSALDYDRAAPVLVIGVVSTIRGEGRTTIASRLALTLAADLDRHVTLIDMDLQRPRLAQLFKVDAGPGLCAVLEGTHRLDAVALPVAKNLSLIPAGSAGHAAPRLLQRLATHDPFHHPGALEGVVILDVPPLLDTSYGAFVAQLADVNVLVVRAGLTPTNLVRGAIARLDNRAPVGIIFNDFRPALPRWWPSRCS